MRRPVVGLFAGLHVIDGDAVLDDAFLVVIEVGIFQALERGDVDARLIRPPQDKRMMIELIRRFQIDAPVWSFRHLVQSELLGVEFNRRRHVHDPDLNEPRPHDPCDSHIVSLLQFRRCFRRAFALSGSRSKVRSESGNTQQASTTPSASS